MWIVGGEGYSEPEGVMLVAQADLPAFLEVAHLEILLLRISPVPAPYTSS